MVGFKKSLVQAILWSLVTPCAMLAQEATSASRSTSSSGQFVVYASDAKRRTQMARRAEEASVLWTTTLKADENNKLPIIIMDRLGEERPRGNPPIVTRIYESDGNKLKIQTDIYDAAVLRTFAFEVDIFRALGLQAIYQKTPLRAGRAFRVPPPWLVEGLAEEIRVRAEGSPDGLHSALLQSQSPPKLEDFLRLKPELLQATSLSLYRAQSLALIRTLQQLPEGASGIRAFLVSLGEDEASLKSLLAAFPSLKNDASSLNKLWTLAIARGTTSTRAENLSVAGTIKALNAIFDIAASADSKKPAESTVKGPLALPLLARSEGGAFAMREKGAELLALEFRSHPLLKPIVAEYRSIVSQLAEKPRRKNMEKRIDENGKILELLSQRSTQTSDYLNWFEATQLDTLSGQFPEITDPPRAEPRTDPITRHMDAIEQRGW